MKKQISKTSCKGFGHLSAEAADVKKNWRKPIISHFLMHLQTHSSAVRRVKIAGKFTETSAEVRGLG